MKKGVGRKRIGKGGGWEGRRGGEKGVKKKKGWVKRKGGAKEGVGRKRVGRGGGRGEAEGVGEKEVKKKKGWVKRKGGAKEDGDEKGKIILSIWASIRHNLMFNFSFSRNVGHSIGVTVDRKLKCHLLLT